MNTANTITARQTTRAPRKTVAEKRAEEQAARDKRDFWLVTVLYKSGSCKHFECRGKSVAIRKLRRLVSFHASPVYLAMHWG